MGPLLISPMIEVVLPKYLFIYLKRVKRLREITKTYFEDVFRQPVNNSQFV